jgi:phage terminase small subunit
MTKRKRQAAMKPQHKVFALTYLANGGNATAAYDEAFGPGKRKATTTHVNASRLLSSTKVRTFLAQRESVALKAIEATAEEAMQVIARTLRLDPRRLLDAAGKALAMKDWPDDVALVVKKVKDDGSIEFYDKLRAAELIAESHGKIKKKLDITFAFDHVKYLADKSRPKG